MSQTGMVQRTSRELRETDSPHNCALCLPCRLELLTACGGWPIQRLTLFDMAPLVPCVAEAIDSRYRHLTCLKLYLPPPFDWLPTPRQQADHALACVQLLTLCGPRLRKLELDSVSCLSYETLLALERVGARSSHTWS